MGGTDNEKYTLHIDIAETLLEMAKYAKRHPEVNMVDYIHGLNEAADRMIDGPAMAGFSDQDKKISHNNLAEIRRVFGHVTDPKLRDFTTDQEVRELLASLSPNLKELQHTNDLAHKHDIETRMRELQLTHKIATDMTNIGIAIAGPEEGHNAILGDIYPHQNHPETDIPKLVKIELVKYAIVEALLRKNIEQTSGTTSTTPLAELYNSGPSVSATSVKANQETATTGKPAPVPLARK